MATGDRGGFVWALVELLALAAFVVLGWPLAMGPAAGLVFLSGVAFVATWCGLALQAYRRAVRRREALGLSGGDGGAIDLLWLAPLLIVVSTFFWTMAGANGSPDAVLARYATAWRHEHPDDAARQFGGSIDASTLAAVWSRQDSRLQNALVRVAATLGPDSGINPNAPFDSLRFELSDSVGGDGGRRAVKVEVVRRASVRDTFFGLFPTTSQRLEPVAELGTIELRLVQIAGPSPWPITTTGWQIVSLDLLSEKVGQ